MLYRFAWMLCRAVLVILRRMDIRGLENIPKQGGLVLVSNHISYWDPVIIGCAVPRLRQVFFMAKAELFKVPLLGYLIRKLGAFPISRGGFDRSAIRTALGHLTDGEIVGIFPEGTRNKTREEMLEPHLGAAMLATRAGVPVLPVAVIGSKGIGGKVTILFGEPLYLDRKTTAHRTPRPNRKELEDISRDIMDKIVGLIRDEKLHGDHI